MKFIIFAMSALCCTWSVWAFMMPMSLSEVVTALTSTCGGSILVSGFLALAGLFLFFLFVHYDYLPDLTESDEEYGKRMAAKSGVDYITFKNAKR